MGLRFGADLRLIAVSRGRELRMERAAPDYRGRPFAARHYAAYVLLCAIWGTTWMAIRILVEDVPPLWGAGVRLVIAVAVLLVPILAARKPLLGSARAFRVNMILALTMMAVPYGLLFWAEQFISSALTALLYSSMPLVVSLLTPLLTAHRVPRKAVLSMTVGVTGIALLFYQGLSTSTHAIFGMLAVMASVCFSSWSALYAKGELHDEDPFVSSLWQLAGGAVLLMGASLVLERDRTSTWTAGAIWSLFFLGIMGSAVAFATYYWLLKHAAPYQTSTISLVIPLIALFVGAVFLEESITPLMIVAAFAVLGAVANVLQPEPETTESMIQDSYK
jgi:putative membrane protein PagO